MWRLSQVVRALATMEALPDSGRPGIRGRSLQSRRIRLNLVSVAVANGLALLTGPILARGLGPSSRGVLAAALLWPSFVNVAFEAGLGDAVNYFTAHGGVSARAVIQRARVVFIPQALGIWIAGVPVVYLAMQHLGTAAVVSSLLVLAVGPAQLYTFISLSFLNGKHRYGWFNVLQIQVFLITAVAYLGLFIAGDLTVRSAVIANDVSILSTFAVTLFVVRRAARSAQPKDAPGLTRRMLGFGSRSWVSSAPHMLNDRLDQLVLSVVVGPRALGWYVIAATIATAPSFVGVAVANSVLPTVASLKDVSEQVHAARHSILVTFGLTFAAAAGVAAIVHPLIEYVFGRSFLGAVLPARLLALGAVMQAETRVFHGLLKGLGQPLDAAKSEVGALVVTSVGLAALVPLLGITGAALISIAAYTTSTVIAAFLASARLGIRPYQLVWPRMAPSAPLG